MGAWAMFQDKTYDFPRENALCQCSDSLAGAGFQAAKAEKLEAAEKLEGAARAAEEAAEEALDRAEKAKEIEVRPDSGTGAVV